MQVDNTVDRLLQEAIHADVGRPHRDVVCALFSPGQVGMILGPAEQAKIGTAPAHHEDDRANREYRAFTPPGPDPFFVVIVSPAGHPVGFLRTDDMAPGGGVQDRLERSLRSEIARLDLKPGEAMPTMRPAHASQQGEIVLHVAARYTGDVIIRGAQGEPLDDKIDEFRVVPQEARAHLSALFTRPLFPPDGAAVGATWEVPNAVMDPVYHWIYPPTEYSAPELTLPVSRTTRAELVALDGERARVRLDGSLKLKHPWWNRDEEKYVETRLVGFVDLDLRARSVRDFRMATVDAVYRAPDRTLYAPFAASVNLEH
jgi:hypothetical protein